MSKRIQVMALAMVLASAAVAQASIENAGTTAGNFLSIGAGAGVSGMGGATLALPNGLVGAAWNPAGLTRVDATELMVSHAGLDNETAQEWFGVGGRFASTSTHWALSGLYHGQGSFEGRDATGLSTGSFGVSDMALGLHVARRFGPAVSAGVGAKYVSEVLDDVSGSGLTFDGGLQVASGPLGFGVAAQNLGGRMNYAGASFPFPSNYGVGASLALPSGVRLAVDANFPHAYFNDVRGGLEWRYRGVAALRVGYRKELAAPSDDPLTGPTFGFGGGIGSMWFDYGYVVPGQGSGQHRFGLTLRPGSLRGLTRGLATEQGTEPKTEPVAAATPPAKPEPAPKATKPAKAQPAAEPVALAPVSKKPAKSTPAPAVSPAPVAALTPAVSAPKPVATPRTTASAPASAPAPVAASVAPPAIPSAAAQVASVAALEPTRAPRVSTPKAPKAATPKKLDAPKPSLPEPSVEPAPVAVVEAPAPVRAVPVATPAPRVAPVTAPATAPLVVQRPEKIKVKSGETLADIAKQWGTSAAAIMMENNLVTEKVKPGQTLKLPKK